MMQVRWFILMLSNMRLTAPSTYKNWVAISWSLQPINSSARMPASCMAERELLERLFAYKVRPATDLLPGKFETGTQNHEGIAGVLGAVEYLEWVGREFGNEQFEGLVEAGYKGRRMELKKAMVAIRANEFELSRALLSALQSVPGIRIFGLTDVQRLDERVPTFSFRLNNLHPRVVAERLAQEGIYVWDGNYYAINVTERLGVENDGGMVRVGAVHYNTLEEVELFKNALVKDR